MNVREGMRRVGIVLGIVGGIAGGFVGYADVQSVWLAHRKFESLMASPAMQKVAKEIEMEQKTIAVASDPFAAFGGHVVSAQQQQPIKPNKERQQSGTVPIPQGATIGGGDPWAVISTKPSDFSDLGAKPVSKSQVYLDEKGNPIDLSAGLVPKQQIKLPPRATLVSGGSVTADPYAAYGGSVSGDLPKIDYDTLAKQAGAISSTSPDGGRKVYLDDDENPLPDKIDTVYVDNVKAIASIQLTTGERVRREPQTFKAYALLAVRLITPLLYPVIGFLIPWSAMRILTWVGTGFFAPQ